MELNKKEIGKRIARVRDDHNLTQDELSERLGYSKNHLSGIECGKFNVTTPFLFKLCDALGKTPDYYLIGQVSAEADELTSLVMRLSDHEQSILVALLKTYLASKYTP